MTNPEPTSCVFEEMDAATAELILQLQLADLDSLQARSKGKQPDGETCDVEIAISMQRQNLESIRSTISDRRMTESIAAAVQTDGYLVNAVYREEQLAREDHALAQRLNGNDIASDITPPGENLNNHILSKLAGLFVSEHSGTQFFVTPEHQHDIGEPSGSLGTQQCSERLDPDHFCTACREPKKYFDVMRAACGHEYCRDCLRDLFDASLTDETLFPPRCCQQPITVESVDIFLTKELKQKFEQKKIEFSTPNKTYCSRPSCSAFIDMTQVEGDAGTCLECGTVTCIICKSAGHAGECPQDSALQAVIDLANEQGWQRCYSCRRLVELDVGCNHMTCRCNAQFCYICGLQWKTCGCAQWDERRLLARACVIVDRGPNIANPADREVQVEQAAQRLRDRHNCAHQSWRYLPGSYRCEECHFTLPRFINECRQCQIQVCNRCRNNRL